MSLLKSLKLTPLFAGALVTAVFLTASCKSEPQKNWPAIVLNMGAAALTVSWNDGPAMAMKARSTSRLTLQPGQHKLTARAEGKVVDEVTFAIESPKDEDITFIYNVGAESGVAVLGADGLYEGGGVFSLTDDKGFPLASTHVGEKLIRMNTKLVLLSMPGERLPQSPPSMYKIQQLCPFATDLGTDQAKIRAYCMQKLERTLPKK